MKSRSPSSLKAVQALFASVLLASSTAWADVTATGDISPANPSTWTASTSVSIGKTGFGSVFVNNGSDLLSSTTILGNETGASGAVTVSGFGSAWTTNFLYVAARGTGFLNVADGAYVRSVNGYLGHQPGSTGTITVNGPGSTWNVRDFLFVGSSGTGALAITLGAQASSSVSYVGYQHNATGTVTVDGIGSAWNATSLSVGHSGAGVLNITNNSLVTVSGNTLVAWDTMATGGINFGSQGGTLTTQSLYASPAQITGTGTIHARGIIADGQVEFDASHALNHTRSWTSPVQNVSLRLDLTGASGAVGDLGAGYIGAGSLTIRDGLAVTSASGFLGYKEGSVGTATVDGIGSSWSNSGDLFVGRDGTGTLNVLNGSLVNVAWSTFVGSKGLGSIHFGDQGGTLTTRSLYAPLAAITGTGSIRTRGLISDGAMVFDATHGLNQTLTLAGVNQNVTLLLDMTGASGPIGDLGAGFQGTGTLTIQDGLAVTSAAGIVGYKAGAQGLVTVHGPSSIWTVGEIRVGISGQGTLQLTGGGKVNNAYLQIGINSNSTGAVTVDGSGSTWTNSGGLQVGIAGTGMITVTGGAQVINRAVAIGELAGSQGVVNVSGSGSTWTSNGSLYVGEAGVGTLNITNGAMASNQNGTLGNFEGSSGTVTVDGTGSIWTSSDHVYVGKNGTGQLNILNGGIVNVGRTTYVGYVDATAGTINFGANGGTLTTFSLFAAPSQLIGTGTIDTRGLVSDVALTFDAAHALSQTLTLAGAGQNVAIRLNLSGGTNQRGAIGAGYQAAGTLTIRDALSVTSDGGILGFHSGSVGTAIVDGAGSTWTSSLTVGAAGTGILNIVNGGKVSSFDVVLGDEAGSAGSATVDGPGSWWSNSGSLTGTFILGNGGTGTLSVTNGGRVNTHNSYLGYMPDSAGTATVAGSGSKWTNNNNLFVGYSGTGALNVTNGAEFNSFNTYLGNFTGSSGILTVDGSSTWNTDTIFIGYAGTGTLNITNGALVNASGSTYIAPGTLATGSINFGSSGGTLTTRSLIAASGQVNGTGMIYTGGIVTDGEVLLDATHGLNQTLTWVGAGKNVTIHLNLTGTVEDLGAGHSGTGLLTISEGISVAGVFGTLGYRSGSHGTAVVDGPGTTWTNSGDVYVGKSGTGKLSVINGAVVTADQGRVASEVGSSGTIAIDGAGSLWDANRELFLGNSGTGRLEITNGAWAENSHAYLAYNAGATGAATVDGIGSKWTNKGALTIGRSGPGSLYISNGGQVSNTNGLLGLNAGSSGTATVDGAGSKWTSTGSLTIGYTGGTLTNVLHISNGGTVITKGLTMRTNALLVMDVGTGSSLNTGTNPLSNSGIIRLVAATNATAGTYTPITAPSWSGTGALQALGGVWNSTAHTFTIAAAAAGLSGELVSIDLFQTQRILVTDTTSGLSVHAAFQPAGAASALDFTASQLSPAQSSSLQNTLPFGQAVITGWNFTASGYTAGAPANLALEIGSGYSSSNLAVWHFDGLNWSPYSAAHLAYGDNRARFTIDSFSGYALAASTIPIALTGNTLLTARNMFPVITDLTLYDGTLDLNGFDQQLSSLSDGGFSTGTVTNSAITAVTLTVSPANLINTSFAGTLSGNLGLTKTGAGMLTLGGNHNFVGPLYVQGGTLRLNSSAALKVHALTIESSTNGTFTATLDLTSSLILQSTDPADKQQRVSQLISALNAGENGGAWTGPGITSSTLANNTSTSATHAVALFDNATLQLTSFGNQPVDQNSLLLSIARLGDTNADGVIDINDLGNLANNWQQPATTWSRGDFNLDGFVDINDLGILANNWQQTSAFPLNTQFPLPNTQPIPEPTTALLLTLALPLLLIRRRNLRTL